MIALGSTAVDKVTGLKGVVVARTSYLYGDDRVSIQPLDIKEGKPSEWFTVDEQSLKMLKDPASDLDLSRAETSPIFPLGSMVVDKVTGVKGMLISRSIYLYGCSRVGIQSSAISKGLPVELWVCDEQSLDLIPGKKPVVGDIREERTGGPGDPCSLPSINCR